MNNRLPILAETARAAHLKSSEFSTACAEAALAAGEALVEAKRAVLHGEWRDWLHQTGIPERTAQRNMLLHRGGCESATVADLGQEECARLSRLGLKLWSCVGGAGKQAAFKDRETLLAIWYLPRDGGIRYGLTRLSPEDPARDWCGVYRSLATPIAVGLMHNHWMGPVADAQTIPIAEAEATLDDWQGSPT